MERIRTVFARIEAHWIGDVLGCACLFGSLYLAMVIVGVPETMVAAPAPSC